MVECPPGGAGGHVGAERGRVSAVVALESIPQVDGPNDVADNSELAPVGSNDAQGVQPGQLFGGARFLTCNGMAEKKTGSFPI